MSIFSIRTSYILDALTVRGPYCGRSFRAFYFSHEYGIVQDHMPIHADGICNLSGGRYFPVPLGGDAYNASSLFCGSGIPYISENLRGFR